MRSTLTDAEALDKLRTCFSELWDGMADFLERTGRRRYEITVDLDDIQNTWREASAAWEVAHERCHGIPFRLEVLTALCGPHPELIEKNLGRPLTGHERARIAHIASTRIE